MRLVFPEEWKSISRPHVRAELMAFLASASQDQRGDRAELEFLVHFIFDDHDFERASELVGDVLIDASEIEPVQLFVRVLDAAIGPRQKPLSAVSNQELLAINDAAGAALQKLMHNGLATFSV
jgi:hypothetical protein